MNELLNAAKAVLENWEQGDLAAAVRSLDAAVRRIEESRQKSLSSESRFTAGPWRAGRCDQNGEPRWLIESDAWVIAETWHIDAFPEQTEANANLIAVAPGLYSTLLAAGNIVRQHNLLSTATDQERRETIERLIDWWNLVALPALAAVEEPFGREKSCKK
jgi:hypothetical protein